MFNFYKEIKSLRDKLRSLSIKVAKIEEYIFNTPSEEQQKPEISFIVDWKSLNAFSLERVFNGGERTIIGYYNSEKHICEWVFHCSREKHEELAKQFSEHIASK